MKTAITIMKIIGFIPIFLLMGGIARTLANHIVNPLPFLIGFGLFVLLAIINHRPTN